MNDHELAELRRLVRQQDERLLRLENQLRGVGRSRTGFSAGPGVNVIGQDTEIDGDLTVSGAIHGSVPWTGVTGKPSTFPPSSHTHPSTYTALTLQNGWQNYADYHGLARYFKDISGVVHLSGLVRNGTAGASIAVLPTGYRPANRLIFRTMTQYGAGRLNIDSNGAVRPEADAQSGWIALDGISFLAEQ